ncbi:hypothetical protein [Clostridioides difficile]|uniref:hypothetical protein n=1 Tax=Clostridioides difficile TaxID=1496 RepID=UPI0018DAFC55|nr:hypothetical protein [Clostridioides difficile]MBH9822386.1 hypothetical protein [Clostridioides difficile]
MKLLKNKKGFAVFVLNKKFLNNIDKLQRPGVKMFKKTEEGRGGEEGGEKGRDRGGAGHLKKKKQKQGAPHG